MANLIDQMNVLKGLNDEHLAQEVNAPSGSAPPFLVLAELNRRKVMREKYAGEQARRKPQSTVAQDVTTSMPPPGGGMGLDAAPPMTGMGGVGSPTGLEAGAAPMPSFAGGGIVAYADGGGIDYDDIAQRYQERLEGIGGNRDEARAMALIAAGANIMGGKSSNAFTNIGAGIGPAIAQYSDAIKATDSEELALLRGITDVGQAQRGDELSALDLDLRRQALAQDQTQFEETNRLPADARNFEYYQTLSDEEKAEYDRRNPPYNPNAITNETRLATAFDEIYQDVLKSKQKELDFAARGEPGEREAILQAARLETYQRIKAAMGATAAMQYAVNAGLSEGDLLMGGAPAAAVTDPFGLGL